MVVNRLILRVRGVVVADIDVAARRRADTVLPSIESDEQDSLIRREYDPSESESEMTIQEEDSASDSDSETSIKEEESDSDSDSDSEASIKEEDSDSESDADSEMTIKEEENASDADSETPIKEEENPSDSDSPLSDLDMPIKKEESPSDSESPLSELSQSPKTRPPYNNVMERFRSYRPKTSPRTWRRISHVVSGRVTKDTPVVNTHKPKIKVIGKWGEHLKYRLPPFNVAREITFPRELTPTKPRRPSVPHSAPQTNSVTASEKPPTKHQNTQ
ncbi:hypothetical protein BJ166DRAFT_492387 [Pestalotiopsis sp. NC0098]|nr:hypothetical protein BJ166DRAFT_492387 [Pestalotiopsis sp. NC0098]